MKINGLSGWKIRPKLSGDPIYAEYVRRMSAEQRKLFPAKSRPIKPDGMSDEDFTFSLQAKSTQEIMTLQKDPNYVRDWTAPIPENYLANPNATTTAELVGERPVSLEEMLLIEDIRRKPKNQLGQSELSGTSQIDKDRAAHHFLVSPPAALSQSEIGALTDLTQPPKGVPASLPQFEWREIPAWKAFLFRLIGREVRSEKK